MIVLVGVTAVVAVAAVVIASVVARRTRVGPPAHVPYAIPSFLDRTDFARPEAPWLVVTFSSATCSSCGDAWEKARLLESSAVAVQEVEVGAHKDLHEHYSIDAVPMILVADGDGDVRASFLGAPTAADLWAALAELREPGSTPEGCDHHRSAPSA